MIFKLLTDLKVYNSFSMSKLGKIVIVGSGAIGSYYGCRLAEAGEDVTFLLRSDYDHVKKHGIEIRSIAGNFHLSNVSCVQDTADLEEADLIIIAWKTTSNSFAEKVIRPLLGKNTAILTLQNGLGNCEHLAGLFGAERIMAGLCFVCINRISPGIISHTASGLIRIGEFSSGVTPRLTQIANAFNASNFPCEAIQSLEKALWMKLVWNFPFNGLAIAEGGIDTKVLLNERNLEYQIRSIMSEVISVAAALGHQIPESFIDKQIEITYPMGGYRPSSMIDFIEGRAVEFQAIWEKPLEVAKKLGLEVPEMEKLATRIQEKLRK